MVLERPDGPFGGVAAMDGRWNQLEIDVFLMHEVFEKLRAFVVESL
jgi:hypothetical protein